MNSNYFLLIGVEWSLATSVHNKERNYSIFLSLFSSQNKKPKLLNTAQKPRAADGVAYDGLVATWKGILFHTHTCMTESFFGTWHLNWVVFFNALFWCSSAKKKKKSHPSFSPFLSLFPFPHFKFLFYRRNLYFCHSPLIKVPVRYFFLCYKVHCRSLDL